MKAAIVGLQWGDEGKGKVLSYLSKSFDWVVRYGGGPNAGHTVLSRGKKIIHHLVPVLDYTGSNRAYISFGVFVDLDKLLEELKALEGIFPGISKRVYLDVYAPLILEWHREEDAVLDEMVGIGTTRRGVGPAASDRVARLDVSIIDLIDGSALSKLKTLAGVKERLGIHFDPEATLAKLMATFEELLRLGIVLTNYVDMMRELERASVIFEGTQGVMLDMYHGTYPFVTSGLVGINGIQAIFPWVKLDEVYGVMKAYTTRVGNGPFPTEIHGDLADLIRKRGGEYGATTGRPRRVGWLDLVALKYAAAMSGVTKLVLTKADVLSGLDKVFAATEYEINGRKFDFPKGWKDFEKASPIYTSLGGWRSLNDNTFLDFLDLIEDRLNLKIEIVSSGPSPDDVFLR